ncbi:hypothetical protein AHAS_Ahas03G0277900 [Arachis hypogaea]|uniref:Pentatricopeptide repeat-containing protein n=1 Tax=Arachis hypogaea TaxID=3818 RepID=A0A445DR80_ARAHY|nr:hypothetical protein Ahy_A03g011610 [Arachis hypogaea]
MVVRGLSFDIVMYTIVMDGLFKVGTEDMFQTILKFNLVPNCVAYSALLDGYCKVGDMEPAELVLQNMDKEHVLPNVVTFSSIMNGYAKKGMLNKAVVCEQEAAVRFYKEMKSQGLEENNVIFDILLKNLKRVGRMEEAESLIKDMCSWGLCPDIVNSLIDGYFNDGNESAALSIIHEMTEKNTQFDVVAYNALIKGLLKLGKYDPESVFPKMIELGLAPDSGEFEKAMDVLSEMLVMGLVLMPVTHKFMLKAASRNRRANAILLGMTKKANAVLTDLVASGISSDVVTNNALIRGYIVGSHVDKAFNTYVLADGISPNITNYNTLLGGLSTSDLMRQAEKLVSEMKERGLTLNATTYNILIFGHGRAGNKQDAMKLYCEMIIKGFVPTVGTYNALINDYAKAGKCAMLENF